MAAAGILDTPVPGEVRWAWRKNFQQAELHNLAMAWNGSRIVFSVTELGPKSLQGDVIIGLDNKGKGLNDWRVSKKTGRLALNGEGNRLLAELEDGSLLYYDDWSARKKPVALRKSAPGAVFSPKGDYILISAPSTSGADQGSLQAISHSGKAAWSCEDGAALPGLELFPFLSAEKQALYASKDDDLVMCDGPRVLWKARLPGRPVAIAASLLEGGLIAAASGRDKGEIRFLNAKGTIIGSASLQGETVSLSCSDVGSSCAALTNGPDGQRLTLFTPDGKEIWKHIVKDPAKIPSSTVVAAHGQVVIAGFEEKEKWSLRAWDNKGKPLWTAPIEGGLADFKVSWNGKRIAVLTKDGRIVFFDLSEKKQKP